MDESSAPCSDQPSRELIEGIRQFNRHEFFECHETLEALWKAERGPIRDLYQGILQVGVGFYHASRGNYAGAMTTLGRGLHRLQRFEPRCQGVEVGELVREAEAAARELRRLGPERVAELNGRLIPTIRVGGVAEVEVHQAGGDRWS